MPLTAGAAKGFVKSLDGHLDADTILIADAHGEPAGVSIALSHLHDPPPRPPPAPPLLILFVT